MKWEDEAEVRDALERAFKVLARTSKDRREEELAYQAALMMDFTIEPMVKRRVHDAVADQS